MTPYDRIRLLAPTYTVDCREDYDLAIDMIAIVLQRIEAVRSDPALRADAVAVSRRLRRVADAWAIPMCWTVASVSPAIMLPADRARLDAEPGWLAAIAAATRPQDDPPVTPGVHWRLVREDPQA